MIESQSEQPFEVFSGSIVFSDDVNYSGFIIIRLQPRFARISEEEREENVGEIISNLPDNLNYRRLIGPNVIEPEKLQDIEEIYFPYLPPFEGEEFSNARGNIFHLLGITREGWTPDTYREFWSIMFELLQIARETSGNLEIPIGLLGLIALHENEDSRPEELSSLNEFLLMLNQFDESRLDEDGEWVRSFLNPNAVEWYRTIHAGQHLDPNAFYSLNTYWRLDLRKQQENMSELLDQLNAQFPDLVHSAYAELEVTSPLLPAYIGDEGINADGLRESLDNINPQFKVNFIDLEQGWDLNHPHYAMAPQLIHGQSNPAETAHGTAVLGIVIADENSGAPFAGSAVPVVRNAFLTSHYGLDCDPDANPAGPSTGHVACALTAALNKLVDDDEIEGGDVILIEAQSGLLPVEVESHNFNTIQLLTAAGLVVIEAGGNGGRNLNTVNVWKNINNALVAWQIFNPNGPNFQASDAAFVSAIRSDGPGHVPNSNFGSRIDVSAWGENVQTLGNLNFMNTSAAAAIIAGAALLWQAHSKSTNNNTVFDSIGMRQELSGLKPPALMTDPSIDVDGALGL